MDRIGRLDIEECPADEIVPANAGRPRQVISNRIESNHRRIQVYLLKDRLLSKCGSLGAETVRGGSLNQVEKRSVVA